MTDEEIKAEFADRVLYCLKCDLFYPSIGTHDVYGPTPRLNEPALNSHLVAYSYKEYSELVARAVMGRLEDTEDADMLWSRLDNRKIGG